MMKPLSMIDTGFLLAERRNQPMHVGGLILMVPPAGSDPKVFACESAARALAAAKPTPPFNLKLTKRGGIWFWTEDKAFDIESHFTHVSLPAPGRIRELLVLVSKLHSNLMDRTKPLWEVYLIDGLEDGRVALYTKVHHSLVDGVAAMKLMQRATAADAETQQLPIWALPPKPSKEGAAPEKRNPLAVLMHTANGLFGHTGSVPKVASELIKSLKARRSDPDYVSVLQAPKTIFNQRISGSRRFAAQSFSIERIRTASRKHRATINDIVLAMCATALHRYLLELGALPAKPLIAMVPVSMRREGVEGGNQIAMVLANLATHIDDPLERLDTIVRSMNNSKERLKRMSQGEILAYLGVVMAAHAVNMALGINPGWQAFNVVISNVPGPKDVRYWDGARVDGIYPVSIAIDGVALNITLVGYHDHLEFGLIACRHTVPHMQNLLQYLEDGLAELE
ncbi:MAG TPA: wax ester/triacylglycerol synthase family O-acyltransferase [Nevskiaceae bacterium]|nr:wax ester/triacylglycerol synthase family O-acyltransferase [Nevskiaceae bacterium]